MKRILILDDNLTICLMLKSWLVKKGYKVETATNVDDAIKLVKDNPFDLILSDIRMPEADGFSFLSWVKRYDSDIFVIMMTGFADVESAVESMKSGAVDYIPKPIDPDVLFRKIDEALVKQHKNREKRKAQTGYVKPPGQEYEKLFKKMDDIAHNGYHVLIIGDRGTGKNSAAAYIYEKSPRHNGPFVILDGSDINSLKNIAATATADRAESWMNPFFESAKGGVLCVKSIENLDTLSQDRLLSYVTTQRHDESYTQIMICTDKSNEEIKKKLIPKLYRHFEKVAIELPSLKNRKEDILFYAHYFLKFANAELNRNIQSFSPEIEDVLLRHSWPENIQEIKNTVLKASLQTEGTEVPKELAAGLFKNRTKEIIAEEDNTPNPGSLRKENYEREKIKNALDLAKWNKTLAASILNIDRKTLYNKIKQYKLEATN